MALRIFGASNFVACIIIVTFIVAVNAWNIGASVMPQNLAPKIDYNIVTIIPVQY